MTIPVPAPRWGVRFTSDPAHNESYLQDVYNEDSSAAKRGELFLNEPNEELYYVGDDGVARTVGGSSTVNFARINFEGIREFSNDGDAASATPPVPLGGLYHTGGVLKVRRA